MHSAASCSQCCAPQIFEVMQACLTRPSIRPTHCYGNHSASGNSGKAWWRCKCREVLGAMATQAMQRLPQFNSQNMSNTLWAFASLNHHPGPMLLKVLQRELVHKLPHFTSQGIENVLWAFATLGHHPGQSGLLVTQHSCNCYLPAPTLMCVSMLWCWEPASAQQTVFCLLVPMPGFKCKNRALACCSLCMPLPLLLLSVSPKRRTPVATCNYLVFLHPAVCQVHFGRRPNMHCFTGEETLMAAAQHIGSILRQFNQQNLALALWAFAKLGWRPHTGLLVDACRHALLTVDSINPQNLSNILWALATMEFIPPAVLLEVCLPLSILQQLCLCCGTSALVKMYMVCAAEGDLQQLAATVLHCI